jgi:ABC-type transporter Mla subunit MlaD
MGVISKIKHALGFPPEEPALESPTPAKKPGDAGAGRIAQTLQKQTLTPEKPVAIDLSEVDTPPAASSSGDSSIDLPSRTDSTDQEGGEERRLTSKKAKQELIAELQKNYKEVLELVRRVQTHLDTQEERSARLMEIVERIPEALDEIPERRKQTERLIRAVEQVAEVGKSSQDVSQQSLRELAKANEQLSRSAQADADLVGAMGEFRSAAETMASDNQRAATSVTELARRSSERDEQLAEAIADGRRWLVIGVTVTAVAAAFAIILSALALAT